MGPSIPSSDLFSVLQEFNPWWTRRPIPDLPGWRRAAFGQLRTWATRPPAPRAVLLSGARQVGKTTLLLQLVEELLREGAPAERVLYLTMDHPLLRLAGIEGVLKVWQESRAATEGLEYLLVDEAQYDGAWATWLKHQVDFRKDRRIIVTGSAMPLADSTAESGVGRWHTIKLPTLSFFEFLQIRQTPVPDMPAVRSLVEVFDWTDAQRMRCSAAAEPLVGHFHEYLLRGGFPQTARVETVSQAQRLLREDIVDKVLKRDMTVQFHVRRVAELERLFLYLCLHDGGILDAVSLAGQLGVNRQTVESYARHLEASHLVYLLHPFGYGKQVLRGRPKLYLADPAIAGSMMLRGRSLLENATAMGAAVEAAFFKHVFAHYYAVSIGFSYWSRPKGEVDVIAEVGDRLIPFEVKYRHTIGGEELTGLRAFCAEQGVETAYLLSRDLRDFRVEDDAGRRVLVIPAVLACLWLGRMELDRAA